MEFGLHCAGFEYIRPVRNTLDPPHRGRWCWNVSTMKLCACEHVSKWPCVTLFQKVCVPGQETRAAALSAHVAKWRPLPSGLRLKHPLSLPSWALLPGGERLTAIYIWEWVKFFLISLPYSSPRLIRIGFARIVRASKITNLSSTVIGNRAEMFSLTISELFVCLRSEKIQYFWTLVGWAL